MMTDSFLIYVFCTSCEPEVVLPFLPIKTNTISDFQFVGGFSTTTWTEFCHLSQSFFLGCNQDNNRGFNFITKKKICLVLPEKEISNQRN